MPPVPAASAKPASTKLMTQQKIDRKIKSGRGTGVRESYEPWIKVWDIKSKGVSHLVPGVKFQRTHHLLSNAEREYHLILEQDPSIIDIREQFPLFTQAETQAIASSLNVFHPEKDLKAATDKNSSSSQMLHSSLNDIMLSQRKVISKLGELEEFLKPIDLIASHLGSLRDTVLSADQLQQPWRFTLEIRRC